MIRDFNISGEEYNKIKPYPHLYLDNAIIDEKFAIDLQNEILLLEKEKFDRYNNPFEEKLTLRDKFNYSPLLNKLFIYLESDEFINKLSKFINCQLYKDETRNFNGVHIYKTGEKLDIHLDAGIHPINKKKKHLTLGIYLSSNWKEEYKCELEIWDGREDKLIKCANKIAPIFNRLILFTCNDYSYHGNPEPVNSPEDAKRIFITISYLSNIIDDNFKNQKQKAFFIARPNDPKDDEKDKLRLIRCNPELYKDVYIYNNSLFKK